MKRPLVLVTVLGILGGLLLSNTSATSACATATTAPDNEVINTVSQTGNADSATAVITITMTPVCLPNEQSS